MLYRMLEIMPFGTNCYIVGSNQTHDGMVIDPAGDAARILSNVDELRLRIGLIVLTHSHLDHTGAISQIKESTGASFAIHIAEAGIIQRYDYSQLSALYKISRPPQPDRLLQDGDSIVVGDLTFQVLHTPGHSSGGICIAGYGVVFSGDTLFNMGIGRTDGADGNYSLIIPSIRDKLFVLPDQTVVLPGHGPKTTIGDEKRNNPFFR